MKKLIGKYNVQGPRYTSYPTVPYWNSNFTSSDWITKLKESFKLTNTSEGISIYIHLPYCESLCTFCGCHKYITKRHEVEQPYIDALLNEWNSYCNLLIDTPVIKELHLGGGTPTFFSSIELERLIKGIFSKSIIHTKADFSFEGHPHNTTKTHLQTLYNLGFKRVSFGVQDYDETVQKAINRNQTFEQVKQVTEWAREIGYESVSHDIIYGLPFQTIASIINTINLTNELKPDRISFYSYAHVPWIKGNGQRGFKDIDLPKNEEKRALYETGKKLFIENEYIEIGMDHFALKTDLLYEALMSNKLHRNFMGYTASKTSIMIGLGASSISDSGTAFAQNEKEVKKYIDQVFNKEIPIIKGYLLNDEDLILRNAILEIICHFKTSLLPIYPFISKNVLEERLQELINDELIKIKEDSLEVTAIGQLFVRNICMAFDQHLLKNMPKTQLFSMTI